MGAASGEKATAMPCSLRCRTMASPSQIDENGAEDQTTLKSGDQDAGVSGEG